ncbi:MAG: hypothetical protein ACK5PD_06740, partial [Pirellulaceae bacterium]
FVIEALGFLIGKLHDLAGPVGELLVHSTPLLCPGPRVDPMLCVTGFFQLWHDQTGQCHQLV